MEAVRLPRPAGAVRPAGLIGGRTRSSREARDCRSRRIPTSKQAGDDAAAKFLTAAKAGNPPDLIQAEYQMLPSFVAADAVADLAAGTAQVKGEFGEGIWGLVTLGTDGVYAIPQDGGPMMLYYRKDLFEKFGVKVPQTWDEYAEAARRVHKADPKVYLGTFSSKDPGSFAGLAQQVDAQWWSIQGESWKVAIDDDATKILPTRLIVRESA
jgi:multiple sugar transport system substrate-binding protein